MDWGWMGSTWSPWSRDGQEIAFVSSANDVVLASADGTRRRTLAHPEGQASLVAISPDGSHVAFATSRPTAYRGRSDLSYWGDTTLWIASRHGEPPVAVSRFPESCFHLAW